MDNLLKLYLSRFTEKDPSLYTGV